MKSRHARAVLPLQHSAFIGKASRSPAIIIKCIPAPVRLEKLHEMLQASSALAGFRIVSKLKPQPEAGCSNYRVIRPIALRRQSNAFASASSRCRPVLRASQTESPEASTSIQGAVLTPVRTSEGALNDFPQTAGIYSIYSDDGKLQYIGLSRKVSSLLPCATSELHWLCIHLGARYRHLPCGM